MTQTTKKQKRRNDLLFIIALMVTVMLAGAALFFLRSEGDAVTVTVDGVVYGTYPLAEDTAVDLPTYGNGHNRLVIRDGVALMENADCPDRICVAHRPISRQGESIVCLPHRVVVTVVVAQRDDTAPDLVV